MKAGSVHTLIMSVNPVYTLSQLLLLKGLKVTTSVSLKEHETALLSTIAAPSSSLFEVDDLSLTKGTYSLTSAYNLSLFDTKQFQDVLMSLNGMSGTYYDYMNSSSLFRCYLE
jgi:molybdopterin-containing oxidoreductase family iron-sulfur binding subunit